MSERSPFDPSLDQMKAIGTEVVDMIAHCIEERYQAASSDYSELEELLGRLAAPPPDDPSRLPDLLEEIQVAAGKGFDTAGPGFVGYIPGGGLYASALADFIACALNRYTGIAEPAPALVQMEASVLRWLCDLFALPSESQGVLTPGGSMANLSAIVAARTVKLGEDFADATMYVSDEAHHSITKSARFAGLPRRGLRMIGTDDGLHMDVDQLRHQLGVDRAAGLRPFLVVASAGTINTGAIDPLNDIADVARAEDLWFHVDAAYGGFFQLTDRGRHRLAGIERADSITLDPHKGMFLPYGTGCLLARDGALLRAAHELHAHYLPPTGRAGLPDFSSYSPELTRDFRGLRMWLPLHLHGVDAFTSALDEKLDLAAFAYEELAELDELEVPWKPQLSLLAFRPLRRVESDLMNAINGTGRAWLSSAEFRGKSYLRMCVLSHRSRPERIREIVSIIKGHAMSEPTTTASTPKPEGDDAQHTR
jgi:aromatic-L-amino-acid decarboxylase